MRGCRVCVCRFVAAAMTLVQHRALTQCASSAQKDPRNNKKRKHTLIASKPFDVNHQAVCWVITHLPIRICAARIQQPHPNETRTHDEPLKVRDATCILHIQ